MPRKFGQDEQDDNLSNDNGTSNNNSFNTLSDPVIQRPHNQPNVNVNADQINNPIPEPSFIPPPLGSKQQDTTKKEGPKPPPTPLNPAMNNLSDKEKKKSAAHVAKIILNGYVMVNKKANALIKLPEKKLNKLHFDGEIDLNNPIPYELGKTLPGIQFIQEYNRQHEDTFVVSEEWRKEVEPVLVRVLEKRGVGMTDETFLAYKLGEDVAIKVGLFIAIKNGQREIIQMMKEQQQMVREQFAASQANTQQAHAASPGNNTFSNETFTPKSPNGQGGAHVDIPDNDEFEEPEEQQPGRDIITI